MARGLGVSQRWWKSLTDGQLGREGGMGCTVEQATEWGTRGGGGGGWAAPQTQRRDGRQAWQESLLCHLPAV